MQRVLRRWLQLGVCAACLLSMGCEEVPDAALLEVDAVGPARIDPGRRLTVEGTGFAVGHDVQMVLIGTLARPFEPDETIEESFAAEAVSETRVELLVTETLLRERFGRATFEGRVEVRFEARWGDGRPGTISGALDDQRIDFVPARGEGPRGAPLAEVLGVELAPLSLEGLEIAAVAPNGPGHALGLSVGDHVVEIGRAHIVPGDSPRVPPTARETAITVLRDGQPTTLHLDVGTADAEEARTADLVRMVQLALLIAWGAILGAWPFARTELAPTRPARGLGRPTLALFARTLLGLLLAQGMLFGLEELPAIAVVIAALVGLRAATGVLGATRPLGELPAIATSAIALATALGALPAVLDVSSALALAEDGSRAPLTWAVFREPVGPLAMALVALALGIGRPTRRAARTLDDLWVLAIAAFVVLAGTGLSPTDRLGTLAMDVAVVGVAWSLGYARDHIRPSAASVGVALLLTGLVVVLASAWVAADPGGELRRALAEVSLAAVVMTLVVALRAAVHEEPPSRPQHALL